MFHFARGLAARQFFSTRDLAGFVFKQVRFRVGGEQADDMANARESALAFVAGKHADELRQLGAEIYDAHLADRIWPGTLALAREHLAAGQRVWLVTATPEELAQLMAERLGLTGALGTRAEKTAGGIYTGRLIDQVLHNTAKADAVLTLAAAEGLDLSRCTAYSDSINDLPMLAIVGRAVAVNPDSALRAEAKLRGWEMRDFRTGRKAARIGVPSAGSAVVVATVTWLIVRHRRRGTAHTLRGLPGGAGRRVATAWRPQAIARRRWAMPTYRQGEVRCLSNRYKVPWMTSRTRSVSSKVTIGSSASAGS